jgi:lipopolysaccharide transport system ATP-binding protein
VTIKGRISSLLEVGTGFHPELTGRENIFLNGAILGMGKREIFKKFDEIIAFSEIEKFLDTPVKYYSSGMYARLGFAIAAHLDPDILIVDEVLAVGDTQFQSKCLKKLDSVSQKGRTIIFVSPNTQALTALCNKGIYLENGLVKMDGSMDKCLNEYLQGIKKTTFSWKGRVGDEALKICSVELKHDHDFFYQNESAAVHLSCELLKPLQEAVLGIEIRNSRQQTVLHSYMNHRGDFFSDLSYPGDYTFSFVLDLNLLWEGEYDLFVHYFIPNKKTICHDEICLKFPVYPLPTAAVHIDYSQMEGIHYPFPWQIVSKNNETHESPLKHVKINSY